MIFRRVKKKFNLFIHDSLKSLGLQLKKIPKGDHEINKLRNINNSKEKIETIRKLKKKISK